MARSADRELRASIQQALTRGGWRRVVRVMGGLALAGLALVAFVLVLSVPLEVRSEGSSGEPSMVAPQEKHPMLEKIVKTEAEWRAQLTPEQYRITRTKGTELACSGQFEKHHGDGVYACVCCGTHLFDSGAKFDSGSGWPAYTRPIYTRIVTEVPDTSHGMVRTEVLCTRCDAHLGHVFDDGPPPKGTRYCINSVALTFIPRDQVPPIRTEVATFGAGCFWGVEVAFRAIPGVMDTAVGYMGGSVERPTYKQVCTDTTGHVEVVQVLFDPSQTSY